MFCSLAPCVVYGKYDRGSTAVNCAPAPPLVNAYHSVGKSWRRLSSRYCGAASAVFSKVFVASVAGPASACPPARETRAPFGIQVLFSERGGGYPA
jgi:hypothetical protein